MSHETEDNNFKNYKNIWNNQISNLNHNKFNIEFKFLSSNENIGKNYVVTSNEIITKCPENYWYSLALKVMSGFDFFMKNDFDLVFKTNLSTIINFKKFYKYCEELSNLREFIYDGFVGHYTDYKFCSGAGMLLNKNSVDLVLKNQNLLNDTWTDDIFIGFILNKIYKITPNEGKMSRFDIINQTPKFTKREILGSTHIRIKIRFNDLDTMYSNIVYNYLNEE